MEYTKMRSGGEKSYATVCLLAALRQTMISPFYLMDEVDVGMDIGNNTAALDILIEQSRFQPDAQFFNITHCDTRHIDKDERYVAIHKFVLNLVTPNKIKFELLGLTFFYFNRLPDPPRASQLPAVEGGGGDLSTTQVIDPINV